MAGRISITDTEHMEDQMDDTQHPSTCPKCDNESLYVEHRFSTTERENGKSDCRCSNPPNRNGIAALRQRRRTVLWLEKGLLGEDGLPECDEPERDGVVDEEQEEDVLCRECYERASAEDWETTTDECEIDEDSHEYVLKCATCDWEGLRP